MNSEKINLHEFISKPKPNLIIIDSLSIKNAPSIFQIIKKQSDLSVCPVIVITQEGISDIGVVNLREGASDYISYKISEEEFYLRIRNQIHLIEDTQNHNTSKQFDSIFPIEDRAILNACDRYVNQHMDAIKNVADLSIAVGLSERKLNEMFKQHTQMTAAEFIRNAKTSRAKELLSTTRMIMSEIASELGYSSAANFATAFKHVEGVTPSQYKSLIEPGQRN